MKTPLIRALAGLAALILAAACVFGGGSDQPNKVSEDIAGTVRGADGQPVRAARVRLFQGTYDTGYAVPLLPSRAVPVAESASGDRGGFAFPDPGDGPAFLEALSAEPSALAITPLPPAGDSRTHADLRLSEAATLVGRVTSKSPVLSLHLAGTHFTATPDSAGRFRFQALPAGGFWLIARLGGGPDAFAPVQALRLEAGMPLDLDSLRVEKDRIPLFDFESPSAFSALRGLGYPYAQPAGSRVGAWTPWKPDTAQAFRGHSFHKTLAMGEEAGFALGNGYYDLSKLASLTFMAKGKGQLDVVFHSALVVSGDPSLRAGITLDSAWSLVAIRPQDIGVPAGSVSEQKGYSWAKGRNEVSKITFRAKDAAADLWLDDIAIEGMSYLDLGPAIPAGSDAFP